MTDTCLNGLDGKVTEERKLAMSRKAEELRHMYGRDWEIHTELGIGVAATRHRRPSPEQVARGLVYAFVAPSLDQLAVKIAAQRLLDP